MHIYIGCVVNTNNAIKSGRAAGGAGAMFEHLAVAYVVILCPGAGEVGALCMWWTGKCEPMITRRRVHIIL